MEWLWVFLEWLEGVRIIGVIIRRFRGPTIRIIIGDGEYHWFVTGIGGEIRLVFSGTLEIKNDMGTRVPITSASIEMKTHRKLRTAKTLCSIEAHPPGAGEKGSGSRPIELTAHELAVTELIKWHGDGNVQVGDLIGKHSLWFVVHTLGQKQTFRVKWGETRVNPWDVPMGRS